MSLLSMVVLESKEARHWLVV